MARARKLVRRDPVSPRLIFTLPDHPSPGKRTDDLRALFSQEKNGAAIDGFLNLPNRVMS